MLPYDATLESEPVMPPVQPLLPQPAVQPQPPVQAAPPDSTEGQQEQQHQMLPPKKSLGCMLYNALDFFEIVFFSIVSIV